MEPIAKTIEWVLAELSTKADVQVASSLRIEKALGEVAERLTAVERESIARDTALDNRLTKIEGAKTHNRENIALAVSIFSIIGVAGTSAKLFGLL